MSLRSTFLIVLCIAISSNVILAQRSETIAKVTAAAAPPVAVARADTSCQGTGKFPLFGPNTCISRQAYTGIFLTSIILAGISFLAIIGLSLLYFLRSPKKSGSDDNSDLESSVADSSSDDTSSNYTSSNDSTSYATSDTTSDSTSSGDGSTTSHDTTSDDTTSDDTTSNTTTRTEDTNESETSYISGQYAVQSNYVKKALNPVLNEASAAHQYYSIGKSEGQAISSSAPYTHVAPVLKPGNRPVPDHLRAQTAAYQTGRVVASRVTKAVDLDEISAEF